MTHPAAHDSSLTLLLIEAGLTTIAFATALCWPRLGASWFRRVERYLGQFARRKTLAVASVGCAMLLLRLALLPWFPPPLPFNSDDFSFLLAADTFAHGRLANPTPVMWTHLESIHITMQPTYMSMYFPGPGLVMAAGKVIFGHPWAGILITGAVMCAALCWMLQAWLPPGWALLGGAIAILRIGLFGYWVNSYTGGATLSALGGALVLGALPRLTRTGAARYGWLMAVGIVLLITTRPYEGMLLCLPVSATLGHWMLFGKNRPARSLLLRRAVVPLLLVGATLAWMGLYDYRAFGKPTTLPYTVSRATYAVVPYYVWQPPHPIPQYRHEEMRRFYTERETVGYNKLGSISGFIDLSFVKLNTAVLFLAGFALFTPLIMMRRVVLDRRLRLLVLCLPLWIAGMAIGVYFIPHYIAPFTAAFYALGLQAMRHLRWLKIEGRSVGFAVVRCTVVVCIIMTALRTCAEPLHMAPTPWPIGVWQCTWIGPDHFGTARAAVSAKLKHMPGKHLVFVRYSQGHEPLEEWVYNDADVDCSQTIWAREMNPAQDAELMHYYKDRDVWLVQPDATEGRLVPYSGLQRLDPRPNTALAEGQ